MLLLLRLERLILPAFSGVLSNIFFLGVVERGLASILRS